MLEKSPGIIADSRVPLALAAIPATGITVVRGYADIFARSRHDGGALGRRWHVARIAQSGAIFGTRFASNNGGNLELIAVGGIDAEYGEIDQGDADARLLLFENWALAVAGRIPPDTVADQAVSLAPGHIGPLAPGTVAGGHGRPSWVYLTAGSCTIAGAQVVAAPDRPTLVFMPPLATLRVGEGVRVEVLDTAAAFVRFSPELLAAEVVDLARRLASTELAGLDEALARRRADRETLDERELNRAFAHLSVIGGRSPDEVSAAGDGLPLIAASRLVLNAAGVALPESLAIEHGTRDPIGRIARAAHVRMRRVALRTGWQRRDNGPLLGFDIEDSRPLALLPKSAKTYRAVDPTNDKQYDVDAEAAAAIAPFGYCFYRPFPSTAVSVSVLFRFAVRDIGRDWLTVLAVGAVSGLLGLATPIFSQMIFDSVIPNGEREILVQMIVGLFAASVGAASFGATQNIALLRMETRMHASIDLALWDRLLDQPSSFYRRFTVGDLAQRAGAVNQIRRLLSTAALSGLLGSVFSLFNLALLFHYSSVLAVTALGLIAVELLLVVASTCASIYFMKRMQERSGRLLSVMNQLLSGIAKLRTAAAEIRAFRRWADVFSQVRHTIWQADIVSAGFETFNSFSSVATILVIFAAIGIAIGRNSGFSLGDFIGFNVAFGALSAAVLGLGATLLQLANVMPLYDRARPILESAPETSESRADPGTLTGGVSASDLHFRYEPDGPPILSSVSISVKPGEFVALVGPSGSGKSTLLRLLLGLERPESGSVFYDGRDLADLDLREVRQQIGVVLQTSRVLPGSILENIVGASGRSEEEAWEAARLAGLDEEIAQMPMRMSTLVMEGGSGLSGGQQQRLQIARAIARKPRLLFLDEATSALDNRTQAIVTGFLKTLRATRIVVAHRLSTIRDADRILVMKGGVIVEEGCFEELAARKGMFAELAARQLQ
jgi:NHLM bacteriocin system ABC transporter ATP-binding protein